jgi:hypothetical protein
MSGPVGGAYPGNIIVGSFACLLAFISAKAARSAYKKRRSNEGWEMSRGLSILTFLFFLFTVYALWKHW